MWWSVEGKEKLWDHIQLTKYMHPFEKMKATCNFQQSRRFSLCFRNQNKFRGQWVKLECNYEDSTWTLLISARR